MSAANDSLAMPLTLAGEPDLQTVWEAWHGATVRLEQTHEALRAEVARLTDELEKKNRELARKNRLADLGQMASHVAHEVRNNLVPVALYLSVLRRRVASDPGTIEIVAKVETGLASLDATVNDLLNFAAERDPRLASVPVLSLVNDLHASLKPQLTAQNIGWQTDVADDLLVIADRDMLRRAVLNLSLNALDAMPDGGRLFVAARREAGSVSIEVADTGPGLSEEARRRAFEPFFTTKSTGTGLGLAIVYRMAEAHGGAIVAGNRDSGGAVFTLQLPHRNAENLP